MPTQLSPTRRGAWLINAAKHLLHINRCHPALSFLENTISAGQCGSFLIKLSSDEFEDTLSYAKVQAHARICGLDGAAMREQLRILKTQGAVDWNSDQTEFKILAYTRDRVLRTADKLFREYIPQGKDKILPEILEYCLQRPRFREEIIHTFSSASAQKDIEDILDICGATNVIGSQTIDGKKLYFNAYQFTDNAEKIGKALNAFSATEREQLEELLDLVRKKPGVASASLKIPEKVIKMATGLGLVDSNPVRSATSEAVVSFLTAPLLAPTSVGQQTEHLEDDVFHHAKMLLASLRYGESYSKHTRGRIVDPKAIVGGLLNWDSVGPCTAIGQDYTLLENEGVIRTERAIDRSGNQYRMSLRRREPAEMVMSLLDAGKTSSIDLASLPRSLDLPTSYTAPEIPRLEEWTKIDDRTTKLFLEAVRS